MRTLTYIMCYLERRGSPSSNKFNQVKKKSSKNLTSSGGEK